MPPFATFGIDVCTKTIFSTCTFPWLLVTARQQLISILAGCLCQNDPGILQAAHSTSDHSQVPRRRYPVSRCYAYRQNQPAVEKVFLDVHSAELPSGYPVFYSFPSDTLPFTGIRLIHTRVRRPWTTAQPFGVGVLEARVAMGTRRVVSHDKVRQGPSSAELSLTQEERYPWAVVTSV